MILKIAKIVSGQRRKQYVKISYVLFAPRPLWNIPCEERCDAELNMAHKRANKQRRKIEETTLDNE